MNRRPIVLSTALATGLVPATLAFGQGYYGPGMMGGYGWGGGWGLGIVGMLLWWVLILLGIALVAKWLFSGSHWHGHREASGRALDILKERYARGEIDKKEFEEKKRDLQ
jgi:putative membrane protein